MTMHLEGPWLTTTGKKKGRAKFASSEHARRAREQEQAWKELMKKYDIQQEERRRSRAMTSGNLKDSGYTLEIPHGRNTTAHIKSMDTGVGIAVMTPPKVYTGTKVKGIATMHKSNAVPVFSDEEAIEISRMRRG
jgi:hypothetical protein